MGFVVGRAFWEQRGSVTIRDAPGKVEQGASVEVLSLLLGKSTSQQFGFTYDGLHRHTACPETEDGARHEVVSTTDDEVARMGEQDGQRIHQRVHVPGTTHRTAIVVQPFKALVRHGLELATGDNAEHDERQLGPAWRAGDGAIPPRLRNGHQRVKAHF